ncbi:MAG TPA: acyl-CoA dehydrogenase family protein, partial [Actinomycetota bacterium]
MDDASRVGLTETEVMLRDTVRAFAEQEAVPVAQKYEERGEDPVALLRRLGELGLAGIPFAEEHGGGGQPYRTYLLVVEELARAWTALAVGVAVHSLVCDAISRFASP